MTSSSILLFDQSAILGNNVHFWREVSRLGECMVPQLIQDEIQAIATGKSESSIAIDNAEAVAKEFLKFLPQSGWQISSVMEAHPQLEQSSVHNLSRKSRLNLAVSQCAYGIARLQPESLVVLVTDEKPLIQAIEGLAIANLCAATAMAVRQWVRTQEAPIHIKKAIATLKVGSTKPISPINNPRGSTQSSSTSSTRASTPIKPRINPIKAATTLISWILGIALLLIAWKAIQPQSFDQMWKKTGLPNLPFSQTKPSSK